jgi:DNA-binding beta-propeller fold protein YncE
MKRSRLFSCLCLGLSVLSPVLAHAVGTRRFVLDEGADFKGGDLEGVAIDTAGGVRAGLSLGTTPISQAVTIWSALAMRDGSLLLGTGNDGKLVKVAGGTSSVVGETKALAVTALAEAWGGKVVVGGLPDGKLWTFERDKLTPLATLKGAEHVWQLAFDAKAGVVYAATGPEGKLFRITANGDAQVYFDAEEQQLMSVAVGPDGGVYAGASDKAKLYKVTAPGRATVLHDFERTEVRAIAVSPAGEVYAIANEIKSGSQIPVRQAKTPEGAPAGPVQPTTPARGKGTLYRFSKDGRPDELLDDSDEHYTSLTLGDDGRPYVGTGAEGRVYTVDKNHNSVLVADVDERQVTALLLVGQNRVIAASDPAVVHPVKGVGGPDAVWTSKVLDAGIRARFGRIDWQSTGPLELSTRSGNTKEPDESWSAWSRPFAAATLVQSPAARYLQVRARFVKDPKAILTELEIAFVTDNLRAVVTELKVKGADDSSSEEAIRSSGGPMPKKADANLNLNWKVDNPDKDELRYRLKYRLTGSNTWYELTKPEDRLNKESYVWDTSDLPEGRYRVLVTASDESSNPPELVMRDELESGIVIVDNTPPVVEGLRLVGRRLSAIVVDGVGPIARVEISAAGSSEWRPVAAQDGIFDEQREELDVDVAPILPAGPVLVSVRAYDAAGNFVVRNLPLK